MRHVLPLIALAALLTAPAQAEKLTLNLAKFDKVQVAALMHVELKQGQQDVTAIEDKGDWSDLKIEVRNSTLFVSRKGDEGRTKRDDIPEYRVIVTAPDFKSIGVAAASEVEGRNLTLQAITLNISSASAMELAGACKTATINVNSAGSFDGERLHCQDATVNASSGASAAIWVSGTATGNASTGGSISFGGNPKKVGKKTSLGGSISID